MKKLVIIGANGHGKVVADIAIQCGYKHIVFMDDNPLITSCLGFPVVGKTSLINDYIDYEYIVAIGNADVRSGFQEQLEKNNQAIATLIHPDAVIGSNVNIHQGTVVMGGVIINADTTIGKGCIINTSASLDHDNVIDDYVHISVGAHLAGTVHVGYKSWIGIGAVVVNNISICSDCLVGAGCVVVSDIGQKGTYIGVPARKIKED